MVEDRKTKYKCLPELVKSALILPHGNADVERSLSVNLLRCRIYGTTESVMVAYTHKYAKV